MKKRLGLIVLLISTFSYVIGQVDNENISDLVCGTELTSEQMQYMESTARERSSYIHRGNDKSVIYIPIQSHIVRRTNGTGGLSNANLQLIMSTINHYYKDIDIHFYECGPTNYIDNDNYYDFSSSDENAISSSNDVNNVINIYYFNSVRSGSSSVCGYSRFPPSPDRVIMANSCALNGSTIVHELGHYFSLYHTHGKTNTGTTDELVNGSNCNFAGDNICDTPADPNLSGKVSTTCNYTGTVLDLNNQPYSPQTENIMSYSRKVCRNVFTAGQLNRVAYSVQNDRSYLFCNAPAPTAEFSSNTTISCGESIQFYDQSSSLATNWVWDFGDGSSSTQRDPIHRYDSSGTYTVQLSVANNNGNDNITKTGYITVNLPTSPVKEDVDTICLNTSTILRASGNGKLYWYDSQSSTTPLGTGDSLTTGLINTNTSFYVEDRIANSIKTVGPTNNTFGSGSYLTSNRHLIFDAIKPFKLISIDVYSATNGPLIFELRNNLGFVLQDTQITVQSNGLQTVILNFDVPAQTDLALGLNIKSSINLYRNSSGVNYPYILNSIVEIKNSSAGTGYYYYFYNWKIQEEDCVSRREEVFVPVKDCSVGIKALYDGKVNIFPNPTEGMFSIELPSSVPSTIVIFDLLGKKVYHNQHNSKIISLDLESLNKGVYLVNVQTSTNWYTQKLILD